eukprot:1014147-Amphidinium_carterae.2
MATLSKQEARITARHVFLADTMEECHRVNNAMRQLSQAEKVALQQCAQEKRRRLHDASSADIRLIETEMEAIQKRTASRSQKRSTTLSFSVATMDQATLKSVQAHGDAKETFRRSPLGTSRTCMRTAPTASWNFDATKIIDEDVFRGIDADDVRVYFESMFVHGQVVSASVCTPLISCLPPEAKSQPREHGQQHALNTT